MKSRTVWRWQRISMYLILAAVLGMLWPFYNLPVPHILWSNAHFEIPAPPTFSSTQTQTLPPLFIVEVHSHDPALLRRFQAAGWPASMQQEGIILGPYLKSFQSKLGLEKIRQITTLSVTIQDI